MTDPLPVATLADLGPLVHALPGPDAAAAAAARARLGDLAMPPGALGRLGETVPFLAGWQGREAPRLARVQALVFAGNHGVCAQGVAAFPQEITAAMVATFEAGGAAINQLCREAGAALDVVALDLDRPTADFTAGDAMTEAEALEALARGAAAVDPEADALVLGEMGIGNSTTAAALAALHLGGAVEDWVGPGAGADDAVMARKRAAVAAGVHRHAGRTGAAALAAIGGREQAALCGAALAARRAGVPVVLDGFICTAAMLPLHAEDPRALDHCLVGHASAEPGHAPLVAALGKTPLLDLGMRLGEGTGAALALSVLRGAVACHAGMATLAEVVGAP
ncbi:nicotinate-nucleotide--dimethylbenzimidazole phosphoribosyltransferase [Rhodosalinus sediminis]|uniref:Nicotinate-nucleotide--dimethylbenzimidazole phosphoribosyltransferase n=1 Tax=Rhodosalinus sediminis TaxID=1940533 RepID=A0A3D9BZ47_9RHOB|nr:nicotinate-nucleotide--dimethylbenzimidazole phosphoribosyltransferase [Rhodosalinus sediminis]REC58631.1 nicotinate-nucleotide--dimethylbenzimidazole phosphoribosyltransferase [Rhodosalinus sediminis]